MVSLKQSRAVPCLRLAPYCNCEARCNLDSIRGHGKKAKAKGKAKGQSVHTRAEETEGWISLKISVQSPVSEPNDLQSRKPSYDDYFKMILESQNLFSSNKIPPWHFLTAAQPESVFGDEEEDPAAEAQRELLKNKKQAGYVPHFDSWVAVTHDQKNVSIYCMLCPNHSVQAFCSLVHFQQPPAFRQSPALPAVLGRSRTSKKTQREWCVRFSIITLCRMMELSFVAPTCVDGSPNDIK